MTSQETGDLKWVGIDLHVHTPASKDYKGGREQSDYLNLIQRANQFGAASKAGKKIHGKESTRNAIGCVVFTDHNSVEGFRRYRLLLEETEKLSKAIRARDPSNSLASQLEKDLEILRSIRVMMGVEIKADPGIHLLTIFAESVEPDAVVPFLEQAYQSAYDEFKGNPAPATRWTLKETLDKIQENFADRAFVVFPHVDSDGGVYEDLKDFQQVRIAALTHPTVKALSFNRQETRDRLQSLFKQPEYFRSQPVAMIQSSDYHGQDGSSIGQPRTEVLVREGKATFKNLKEAFREIGRVKCSIDFVAEEYNSLVRDAPAIRYKSEQGSLEFCEADFDKVAESVCGMLNSDGGILELEGDVVGGTGDQSPWSSVRDQLTSFLRERLRPPFEPFLTRSFQFSPGKVRILNLISRSNRLHMANGKVFVNESGQTRQALPIEIEYVVSRNLDKRFGKRFEDTLESVSKESILLSKLSHGIPLILASQRMLLFQLTDSFKCTEVAPATDKGREAGELLKDLLTKELEEHPFGQSDGNASILAGSMPPRERDHYLRFTTRRAEVDETVLQKIAWGKIEKPAIVIYFSGFIGWVEPGYIISDMPAVLIQVDEKWQEKLYSILAWWKSSFFVWYSAVRLGDISPFIELQWRPYRVPIPRPENGAFLEALAGHARQVISEEKAFMNEINRLKKKGTLDSEYQEKARKRHNVMGNKASLVLDKEVFKYLALNEKDQRFIAQTLRDVDLTDFGLAEELESNDQED